MLSKVKVQAKTVADAIKKGLKELNMRRDQVEVKVLEHPKKGFLGFGSKPAIVEVRQKRWIADELDSQIYMDVPKRRRSGRNKRGSKNGRGSARRAGRRHSEDNGLQEARVRTPKPNEPQRLPSEAIQQAVIPQDMQAPLQMAKDYISNVLLHMGVKAENVNVWWDEKQQRILITFDCDKPAIVIGKEGKTLEAIQYLATLAVTRQFDKAISVVADTQNYWRKAEDKIDTEIARGLETIKRGASVFRFRPMSAQLRRYIHRAVEGNEYVTTSSEGEGKWRKVTFRPTPKALEEAKAGTAPADFVPGVIGEDVAEQTATPQTTTGDIAQEAAAAQRVAQQDMTQEQAEQPDDGPTQRIAKQTVAATVAETVVQTTDHVLTEHSVIITTETKEN